MLIVLFYIYHPQLGRNLDVNPFCKEETDGDPTFDVCFCVIRCRKRYTTLWIVYSVTKPGDNVTHSEPEKRKNKPSSDFSELGNYFIPVDITV